MHILKALFSNEFFSYTEPCISTSVALTHQTLHLYSRLCPEGFYGAICLCIICLIIYNILIPKNFENIVFSVRSKRFLNYGVR